MTATMTESMLEEEAELCRQRALAYLGRPEATFLLRLAREYEALAKKRQQPGLSG
jgi:hypothetical protein